MVTGELKSKIDRVWDTMWSGGVSNPLSVIEQLTYLLFIKRLDDLHTLAENKAARLKKPIENPIFPEGKNLSSRGNPKRPYADLRWSRFRDFEPETLFEVMRDDVFPFMKALGGREDSTYSHHMKEALFAMPSARVLANVVDQLDHIPMADRDTKGDIYEYMLGKIAAAGQNGQFRTPRHIIRLMVEMTAPAPKDTICDPACGTCGFLVAASEHLREHHGDAIFTDAASRRRFNEHTFHGYDFDATMLRIGSMNMLLHGVENPDIRYKDSLEEAHAGDAESYSLLLANPPFAGSLDYEATAKDLLQIVKTKKTELLFLALFLRLLKTGGRAAVIVPDGVLFGSSNAHKQLRQTLVEKQKLEAVISMPGGVFKPYAGVSTAILLFTKTNSGGTDHVWFYDMQADGFSLDDKRTPLLPPEKLGPTPSTPLTEEQHAKNNLPDLLSRWRSLKESAQVVDSPSSPAGRRGSAKSGQVSEQAAVYRTGELARERIEQSFCVSKADIAAQGYDLSLNRYKEVVHEEVAHRPPGEILKALGALEAKIQQGMKELEGMLK